MRVLVVVKALFLQSKFLRFLFINKLRAAGFVVGFATVGTLLVLLSRAAGPDPVAIELEGGVRGGTAMVVQDTTASGGSAVQFLSSEGGGGNIDMGYEASRIPNRNQPDVCQEVDQVDPCEKVAVILYVSQGRGNDNNTGTNSTAPLKTMAKAMEKVRARSEASFAVLAENGIYRESLGDITKKVIIQPVSGHNVWLSGSDVVSSWTASNGKWNTTLELSNSDLCTQCRPAGGDYTGENEVTLRDNPAMVFINGEPLAQKASVSEVSGNSFATTRTLIDNSDPINPKYRYTFTIGIDPANKVAEVTTRILAMKFMGNGTDGSIVRGIGIRNYGTNYNFGTNGTATKWAQPSQITVVSRGVTIKDNYIGYAATDGLGFYRNAGLAESNGVVINNTLDNNGHRGVTSNEVNKLSIYQNRITANNRENFRWYSDPDGVTAAGAKIVQSKSVTVDNNVFSNNNATGFWCDIACIDVNITRNHVVGNKRHGIFYEISAKANIISNLVYNNDEDGILVGGSGDDDDISRGVAILNNTVVKNGSIGISVYQVHENERNNAARCQPSSSAFNFVDCVADNVTVKNNLVANMSRVNTSCGGVSCPLVRVEGQYRPQNEVVRYFNHNLYSYEGSGRKLMNWRCTSCATTTANFLATTLQDIQTKLVGVEGNEVNGKQVDTTTGIGFRNISSGSEDFRLTSGNAFLNDGGLITGNVVPVTVPSLEGIPALASWLTNSATPPIGLFHL